MPTEDPKEPDRETIIPPGRQSRPRDERRNPPPVIDAQAQELGASRESREEHRQAAEAAAAAAGVGAEPERAGAASESPTATVTVEDEMGPPSDNPREDTQPHRRAGIGSIAASALLGGLIGAGLMFCASQLMPSRQDAALKAQLDALDGRVSSAEARSGEIEAVGGRVASLEDSARSLAELTQRVTDVEKRLAEPAGEDVSAEIGELRRRVEELASGEGGALLEVAAQLQKLEDRVGAMEKKAPEVAAAASSARASSRSAALSNLRAAVEAGRPYAAELNVVSKGASKSVDLAPLQKHAAEGVVSLEQLASTLESSRAAVLASEAAAAESQSSSWMDKMWSSAKSVVRISRSDDKGADKVLDRMKPLVASGDLDGALRLAETLPEAARAPLAPWLDRMRARIGATATLTRLEQSPAPAVAPAREG